jgi:glycerol-3-phosphate acyltransferase PlsY
MKEVLYILSSYLVGAIPTGYLMVRLSERRDIRASGSGNIGATNVLRVKGWAFALPVVVFDVAKGFFPAWLALRIFPDSAIAPAASLAAILGHCFPVYIGFRGGKGVATALGSYAALGFAPFLVSAAVFLAAALATRYVSLGSLLAAAAFPAAVLALGGNIKLVLFGVALAALIVFKHRANIGRLKNGTERKLGGRAS